MLKNYYLIDENKSVENFLKNKNDKKNMLYIILDTNPETFVDSTDLALKVHNLQSKLKTIKKTLPTIENVLKNRDKIKFLLDSGQKICKINGKYYDIFEALTYIQKQEPIFLKNSLSKTKRKEIFVLNLTDKISQAKKILTEKKFSILPVINENNEIVGEIRTFDLLVGNLYNISSNDKNFYSKKYENTIQNLSISQIMNTKPLILNIHKKIKNALNLMLTKKIPEIITCDENQRIFSIVSYKEIILEYLNQYEDKKYSFEIVGMENLLENEKIKIEKSLNRFLRRISKSLDDSNLKIYIKSIHSSKNKGLNDTTKYELKINLFSKNQKPLHYEKNLDFQKKTQEYNRNITKILNEGLKSIEIQLKK